MPERNRRKRVGVEKKFSRIMQITELYSTSFASRVHFTMEKMTSRDVT